MGSCQKKAVENTQINVIRLKRTATTYIKATLWRIKKTVKIFITKTLLKFKMKATTCFQN